MALLPNCWPLLVMLPAVLFWALVTSQVPMRGFWMMYDDPGRLNAAWKMKTIMTVECNGVLSYHRNNVCWGEVKQSSQWCCSLVLSNSQPTGLYACICDASLSFVIDSACWLSTCMYIMYIKQRKPGCTMIMISVCTALLVLLLLTLMIPLTTRSCLRVLEYPRAEMVDDQSIKHTLPLSLVPRPLSAFCCFTVPTNNNNNNDKTGS